MRPWRVKMPAQNLLTLVSTHIDKKKKDFFVWRLKPLQGITLTLLPWVDSPYSNPLVRLETFCTRRRPSLWWPIFPQDILLGILPTQILLYFPLSVCECHLLLSPLDLGNLWNPFNRIRIMMGKFGCTQIRTSSSCSSEKKKDFLIFLGWLAYHCC